MDAAEAYIRSGAVGSVGGACSDSVAIAVGGVAEERASLHYFGLACGWAGRIVLRCSSKGGVEPVGAPLPYVAGDRVKAEGVGWKAVDRTCAGEAIFGSVDTRELTLPDVAEVLAVRGKIIAPGIELLLESAASGVLPLGFGR